MKFLFALSLIGLSNRHVLFGLGMVIYIGENIYFGWNEKPLSFAELWCDKFVIALWCLSLFIPKKALVLAIEKEQDNDQSHT